MSFRHGAHVPAGWRRAIETDWMPPSGGAITQMKIGSGRKVKAGSVSD